MGMPRKRVKDIVERTKVNFDFVWEEHKEFGLWEVTQLLNSFLGAFIHVKESFYSHIPTSPIEVAWQDATEVGFVKPTDWQRFATLIRHGLSHGNIELIPNNGEIGEIRVWNIIPFGPKKGTKDWSAVFTVEQLKDILLSFVTLMLPILEQHEAEI